MIKKVLLKSNVNVNADVNSNVDSGGSSKELSATPSDIEVTVQADKEKYKSKRRHSHSKYDRKVSKTRDNKSPMLNSDHKPKKTFGTKSSFHHRCS